MNSMKTEILSLFNDVIRLSLGSAFYSSILLHLSAQFSLKSSCFWLQRYSGIMFDPHFSKRISTKHEDKIRGRETFC